MRKKIFAEIEVPEGVSAEIEGSRIFIRGGEGEISKEFAFGALELKKSEGKIIIGNEKSTKREKKQMNTIRAHIKNMIKGVQNKYEYRLKICYSHFPFTVEVKGGEALIKNFLGEKNSRKVSIPQGAEVEADREFIDIKSIDKELAGQVAANFERATKVKARDRRIFQDGIFMVNKAGRKI